MKKQKFERKDLILTKDTVIDHSIVVKNIICKNGRWNLIVIGNIDARDIDAWDIDAEDINAWDIDARDIDALYIICEKRIKKSETAKTKARIFIQGISKLERKEW
jgi:hypothetical protein